MAIVTHVAAAVSGAGLIAAGGGSFWYLMPRNGRVHRLVEKWDGGQMLTIALMILILGGIAAVLDGLFG